MRTVLSEDQTGGTMEVLFLAAVSLGILFQVQPPDCPNGEQGRWSVEALDLCTSVKDTVPDFTRSIKVVSPDGQATVHVEKTQWWVVLRGKRLHSGSIRTYVTYPSEIAWAPDSKAFYITQSDGNIAGFHTSIYLLSNSGIRSFHLNHTLEIDFERRHKCSFYDEGKDIGDHPNIAGIKWIDGSNQLLVAAEVPPHGMCPEPGYFGGYLISVPGMKVVSRHSPQQMMEKWASVLGERLKGDFSDLSDQQRVSLP